jgi:hypothetical protein
MADDHPTPQITLQTTEPDWNAIQERYLQGDALTDIANDYGTTPNAIATRACRLKWKDQQLRLLRKDQTALSEEIKGNLLVSILRESRMFYAQEPSIDAESADLWSKVRERLINSASKLLNWDADPVKDAKQARVLDV